jgi:hypothetical protein
MSDSGATITTVVTGQYSEPATFADHANRAVLNNQDLTFIAETVSPHPEVRDFSGKVFRTVGSPDVPGGLGSVFMTDHAYGIVHIIISRSDVRATYNIP